MAMIPGAAIDGMFTHAEALDPAISGVRPIAERAALGQPLLGGRA